jgi:hypothetical protein
MFIPIYIYPITVYKLTAQVIVMIPIVAMNLNGFSTQVPAPQLIQYALALALFLLQCSTYEI